MKPYTPPTGVLTDSLAATVIRFGCYTVGLMLFFLTLPKLVEVGDITIFKEHGVIEWVQIKLLAIAAFLFLAASMAYGICKHAMVLLSLTCMFAVVRELDATLDQWIPVIGWKVGIIIPVAAAGYAWKHRRALRDELAQLITTRSFGMLWVAFVVAVPFGQLVGHGTFLQMVMGDDYTRMYKRVIEEMCELVGYLLILIGSIEMHVQLRALVPGKAKVKLPASAVVQTR